MAFHTVQFWEERYLQHPEFFDWYAQFPSFKQFILPSIETSSKILILGGGTSRMPYQLYDMGFKNITVVDFAEGARCAMKEALEQRPEIKYEVCDISSFTSKQKFDLIVDKGTLDCVLSNPSEPLECLKTVINNISELMEDCGKWISISFDIDREEHFKDAGAKHLLINQSVVSLQMLATPLKKSFYVYGIVKK